VLLQEVAQDPSSTIALRKRKTHLFFEVSLCLSGACLGKMIIYSNVIKNGAKEMSFPHLGLQLASHERVGEERLKRGLRNVKTHLVSLENSFS